MPKGEEFLEFKVVVLLLGIAKLVNMSAGISHHIIAFSKYFRLNFFALVAMAIVNVGLNLAFIPGYGIKGAAMATLASISFYNLAKYFLVYRLVGIQPFTKKTISALLLGVCVGVLALSMPSTGNCLVDIILRSSGTVLVFGALVLYGRISEDVNEVWEKFRGRIRKR
jgi:O-antigen/teichoic acid export membrane protein